MKNRRSWYLLAYDIRNPRRLQRTHAFVKKHGVGLQRSVFLFRADSNELAQLKKGVLERVNRKQDDVRLYPVSHPDTLWAAGKQEEKINGLYSPVSSDEPSGPFAGIVRLFSRKKHKRSKKK